MPSSGASRRVRLWSLRTQIVAWSFVPTAIILLAVALVAFYAYQRTTTDLVLEQSGELTRLTANQLATNLRDYSDVLEGIARSLSDSWDDDAVLQAGLRASANRLVIFDDGVIVLDNYGRVRTGQPRRPDLVQQDWSNRPFFRDVIGNRSPSFSDVSADGPDGARVVMLAVPVTNNRSEMLGALVGLFRVGAPTTSALYGSIIRLRAAPGVNTVILDSSGATVYQSEESPGETSQWMPTASLLDAAASGTVRSERAGRPVVTSRAVVPGTSWNLVRETDWASLMEPSQSYRQFLILLLGLGVLVPALVVALGVRRITRPIDRLTYAAQEVAGGKFGQTITSGNSVEVQRLVEQFNSMSRQLSETYEDLRGKNEQLELVMAGTNDGIWDWDLRSNNLYLSPRWKSMLGYSDDELPNSPETWSSLVHLDDLERVAATFNAYMAGEMQTLQSEHRSRHKDGSYRWLLMRGIALRDATGKPYRVAGSNADITELKRAQGIQHAQSRLLEGVATGAELTGRLHEFLLATEEHWPGARCVIWLVGGDTGELTPAARGGLSADVVATMWGFQKTMNWEAPSSAAVRRKQRLVIEDIATDPRWDIFPETRAHALSENLRAAWAEPIVNMEGTALGSFSVYYSAPHKTTEEEIELIQAVAHLVGVAVEARRAEQALRASEVRFRSLFESADVAIVISDMNGELLEANPALTRLLGLTAAELAALPLSAYIHPDDTAIHDDLIQELHEGKRQRYQIERRYLRKDGEVMWGRLTVTLARQADGKPMYRIAMLEDITEERQAQEQLNAAYRDLERRVQERTRALIALNTVASVVSRSLEVREIARDALAVSTEVVGCDYGAVHVTVNNGAQLELVASANLSSQFTAAVQLLSMDLIAPSAPERWEMPRQWAPADLADGPLKEAALGEGIASTTAVPLVAKDRLVGSMWLSCDRPRELTAEDSGLLIAIGRQIGVGIENAQLYATEQERRDEAERRRRVAEGLREILSVLNSGQSLQETLDLIAWQACHVLGADAAALMRLNPDDGVMSPQAHHGLSEGFVVNLRIRAGQVASGRALAQNNPVLITDTAAFLEVLRKNDEMSATMPESVVEEIVKVFRALLSVPVFIGDRPYGALSLYYHQSRPFSEEEIDLVQTMADQAALAIEAARLREQAKTSAAAEERNRLARELHDSVTQNLYSVTLYAEAAARLTDLGQTVQAAEHLRNLRDASQEALREMRLLIFELRPMDLQKMGLAGAIQARLQAVETRGGIEAQLLQDGIEFAPLLSQSTQEELYHIAQEALNNTLKHSRAKHVIVSLTYGPHLTRLQVQDDGVGFVIEAAEQGGGLGLAGMRERVQHINGRLTLESAPGQGATVVVEAPVETAGPRA